MRANLASQSFRQHHTAIGLSQALQEPQPVCVCAAALDRNDSSHTKECLTYLMQRANGVHRHEVRSDFKEQLGGHVFPEPRVLAGEADVAVDLGEGGEEGDEEPADESGRLVVS